MKLGYSFFNIFDSLTCQENVFCHSHTAPQSALPCKAGKIIQWETARSELGVMEKSPGEVHNCCVPQECPGMLLGTGKTVPAGTGKNLFC